MKKFLMGKKLEMTQIFDEKGNVIPVTLVESEECVITQIKTKEKDGYDATQIGFIKKTKNIKKTDKTKEFKHIKEFRNLKKNEKQEMKKGDKIDVSIFEQGDKVKVSGVSRGKGFQGAVKRWGFHGRNATHGVKHEQRTLGSVGCAYPQRVIKGKKMPGRMGFDRVSIKNLKIIKIDKENNLIAIKGAVPGRRGTLLEIRV
ncbi:MAG: 50S ribosomal protein L3 [Patescibacteria group bacterium]|nr:50S ribosomal protein L3 [Patescibacteria group bacterium]